MNSLNKHTSSHHPKHDSGKITTVRRIRRRRLSSEQLTITPVPREELPDEMRSVLESFISSRRPSLADVRLARSDVPQAGTSARSQSQDSSIQGRERYDYDGRDDYGIQGPNPKWPFSFTLEGKKFPSRVHHTHKVVARSRPNAKEQMGKRKWHPSKRHGRVIRQEDYDAHAAHELGQRTQFLNSESLLNLSVKGGRAAKGMLGKAVGGNGWWKWPCRLRGKLGKVTKGMFRRV